MDVWVSQWEFPNGEDHNIEIWSTEQEALQDVCNDVQHELDGWDMNDPDIDDKEAREILIEEVQTHIAQSNLRAVMYAWNDFQDDHNPDNGEWYSVFRKEVKGAGIVTPDAKSILAVYKASTPGATCRGPCKQFNPHAYADRPDGTHVCHQCATFKSIFGVKP